MTSGPDDTGSTGSTEGATGRVDDEQEAAEESSTTDGPAADGEYDPAQGSPAGGAHPVAEDFPQEDPRHDA